MSYVVMTLEEARYEERRRIFEVALTLCYLIALLAGQACATNMVTDVIRRAVDAKLPVMVAKHMAWSMTGLSMSRYLRNWSKSVLNVRAKSEGFFSAPYLILWFTKVGGSFNLYGKEGPRGEIGVTIYTMGGTEVGVFYVGKDDVVQTFFDRMSGIPGYENCKTSSQLNDGERILERGAEIRSTSIVDGSNLSLVQVPEMDPIRWGQRTKRMWQHAGKFCTDFFPRLTPSKAFSFAAGLNKISF